MDGGFIRGDIGQIKWSYYNAAAILGYTVLRTGPKTAPVWTLVARVIMTDPYKMSQRPLVFVAPYVITAKDGTTTRGAWTWPLIEWSQVGAELRAALGPPIEEAGRGLAIRTA